MQPAEISHFALRLADESFPYGMGCAWVGRKGEETKDVEIALLEAAYASGFRYFDTAHAYGESEVRVGQFLRNIDRRTIFLATKMNFSPSRPASEQIRSSVERSLERLGVDYLDLIQIHDIEQDLGLFDSESLSGTKEVVQRLKEEGLIRGFGLATRSLDLHLKAFPCGLFDTSLTYSDLTPLDHSAEVLVEPALGSGVAMINGSPLAGLLNGRDPSTVSVHPSVEARRQRAVVFYEFCKSHGVSVLAAALQFPLRFKTVEMHLTGPATDHELKSTLAALQDSIDKAFWEEWATIAR